jgi:hypothetical protein
MIKEPYIVKPRKKYLGGALVGLLGLAIAVDIAGKVIKNTSKAIGPSPITKKKYKGGYW